MMEKANILQNQFSSVFAREPTLFSKINESIRTLRVTRDTVKENITAINANKSCGPDDIHPRLPKELIDHISKAAALLLNETMEHGEIPEEWKPANVSPNLQERPKHLAENYRPISLTSIVGKLMETFFRREMMAHLIDLYTIL